MKSQEFCYWLQGYFELSQPGIAIEPNQVKTIKKHLALVFFHEIDPEADGNDPETKSIMQAIHDGKKKPVESSRPEKEKLYRC